MRRLLQFRVGGILWLLVHECRLFFYEIGDGKLDKNGKRSMPYMGIGMLVMMLGAIHLLVWAVMDELPALTSEPSAKMLMSAAIGLVVVFNLMLSLALNRSVRALFERGDIDFLLSSPLSARTIFRARLAGIVFGVALLFLLFLTPFAHVGLSFGEVRWLGIYPTLISLALIASSIAMLLTLGLVKLIGVRHALTVAQLLAGVTVVALLLTGQFLSNDADKTGGQIFSGMSTLLQKGAVLGPNSLLWIPARAVFGSPLELAGFASFGVVCFWLTTHFMHDFFVNGVRQTGGMTAAKRGRGAMMGSSFHAGIMQNVLLKEWRLITRDPQLISYTVVPLLLLLPLLFWVFQGNVLSYAGPAGLTYIAMTLAAALISIVISAEDAPDLLLSSPAKSKLIHLAKLTAAISPTLVVIIPLLEWLMRFDPLRGFCVVIAIMAGTCCTGLIRLWLYKPGSRQKFNKHAQFQIVPILLELISNVAWAGAVYVGLRFGAWGLAPLALAVLALLGAWLRRIE
jgi:ABC-2 type transport system permease protein